MSIKDQALYIGQVQRALGSFRQACDTYRQVRTFQCPLIPLLPIFQLWWAQKLESANHMEEELGIKKKKNRQ